MIESGDPLNFGSRCPQFTMQVREVFANQGGTPVNDLLCEVALEGLVFSPLTN